MRRALIVGIDDYDQAPLTGCVNDATVVAEVLRTHGDQSPNFGTQLVTSPSNNLTRSALRDNIERLFATECDIALFYFSGHGFVRSGDGCIVTKDAEPDDEEISMTEILGVANRSPVKNKIIILDCCYSGMMGTPNVTDSNVAQLSEGLHRAYSQSWVGSGAGTAWWWRIHRPCCRCTTGRCGRPTWAHHTGFYLCLRRPGFGRVGSAPDL